MSLYKEKLGGALIPPPEGGIHFKTSKAMSGVNFFPRTTGYDFSSLQVYVNDKRTNIPANSLTADAGDDIKIVSRSETYPFFYPSNKDYISSIEGPLPFMGETDFSSYFENCLSLVSIPENLFINNPQITSFNSCFNFCNLTFIPVGLFVNNPNVTDFHACFYYCYYLTSIPQGLFDNNPNVTDFSACFGYCNSLTAIPQGLFDKNIKANDFTSCFRYSRNLKVNVRIGSTTTNRVYISRFAEYTAAKGTVYCRAGSNAYNAFLADTSANVNVLTY